MQANIPHKTAEQRAKLRLRKNVKRHGMSHHPKPTRAREKRRTGFFTITFAQ